MVRAMILAGTFALLLKTPRILQFTKPETEDGRYQYVGTRTVLKHNIKYL